MTDRHLDLAALRRIAEAASHEKERGIEVGYGIQRLAFQWIDNADPSTVLALIDRLETLQAERDGIRRRDEEVGTDEGWWVGGAWGDYGEAVVPLRILSYVIDGALDQKVESIDPGFALTYAEQVARADRAEARLARVTELCESQTEGIRAEFKATGASPARDLGYADACDDVLFTIRAVAADEQEATDG